MNKKLLTAVILNYAVFVMEVIASVQSFISSADQFGCGFWMFKNYTQDSNIFAGIVSLIFAIEGTMILSGKKAEPGRKIHFFRFMTTCCLTVTFLVVAGFLAPTSTHGYMYELVNGALLYMHTLCPIISIISFIFLEPVPALKKSDIFTAIIPTLIYAAVILTIIGVHLIEGRYIPYSFLRIYDQSILTTLMWIVIIIGGNLLITFLINLANKKLSSK